MALTSDAVASFFRPGFSSTLLRSRVSKKRGGRGCIRNLMGWMLLRRSRTVLTLNDFA